MQEECLGMNEKALVFVVCTGTFGPERTIRRSLSRRDSLLAKALRELSFPHPLFLGLGPPLFSFAEAGSTLFSKSAFDERSMGEARQEKKMIDRFIRNERGQRVSRPVRMKGGEEKCRIRWGRFIYARFAGTRLSCWKSARDNSCVVGSR